jgi:hypothetical protein
LLSPSPLRSTVTGCTCSICRLLFLDLDMTIGAASSGTRKRRRRAGQMQTAVEGRGAAARQLGSGVRSLGRGRQPRRSVGSVGVEDFEGCSLLDSSASLLRRCRPCIINRTDVSSSTIDLDLLISQRVANLSLHLFF